MTSASSATYNRKSSSPSTEPCGTPNRRLQTSDSCPSKNIWWVRPLCWEMMRATLTPNLQSRTPVEDGGRVCRGPHSRTQRWGQAARAGSLSTHRLLHRCRTGHKVASSRWSDTSGRLTVSVRLEISGQLTGNDSLNNLRYKRQIWCRTVVAHLWRLQRWFLQQRRHDGALLWCRQRIIAQWCDDHGNEEWKKDVDAFLQQERWNWIKRTQLCLWLCDHALSLICWTGLQRRQRSISQSPDDRCWSYPIFHNNWPLLFCLNYTGYLLTPE